MGAFDLSRYLWPDAAERRQPGLQLRIKQYWLDRGLVLLVHGGRYLVAAPGEVKPQAVASGAPKTKLAPFGSAQGFGATYGSGTTDILSGGFLPVPKTGVRSIVGFLYANSTGGGGLGRCFQDQVGSGLTGGSESLYFNANRLVYTAINSAEADGAQSGPTANFPIGRWVPFGITHDRSTFGLVPAWYIDGAAVAASNVAANGPSYSTVGTNLRFGNRPSDNARSWDGMIGPILFFDGPLTPDEHAMLAIDPWQALDSPVDIPLWVTLSGSGLTAAGGAQAGGSAALAAQASLAAAGEATAGGSATAGISITINNPVDRGTIDLAASSVTPNGTTPTITLRNRFIGDENAPGVRLCFGSVSGVNGLTPQFRIVRANLENNYTGNFVWSVTGALGSWQAFANKSADATYLLISHNVPFAEDTIYIAQSYPWRVGDTLPWIQSIESSGLISTAPSGGASYQFETRSATTNGATAGAGDVIPAQPLYSFRVGSSGPAPDGNPKRKLVLMSGVHAAEDVGNYALKGAVEFLVGADAAAVRVRDWFEIFVYPLVAAAGRAGGGQRTDFEDAHKTYDVNRNWNNALLETVVKHKAAIQTDAGSTLDVCLDFHGSTLAGNHYIELNAKDATAQTRWSNAIRSFRPGMGISTSETPGMSEFWAKYDKAARYGSIPESIYTSPVVLADIENFGADHIRTLDALLQINDFGGQVALAGVGVAIAGGSAAAGVAVPLAAAGLAQAGGGANATATVTISAAGLAQAAGAAGLSAAVLLQAAGAAQASGNAALAAQLNALAAGAAAAGGSANLTGGAPGALSAAGSAEAGGAAALVVTVQLAAAGGAQAGGNATLSGGAPGDLAASGSAAASGAGTLAATVQITAAGFVQAMGQGALAVQIPLAAFGAALAGGSATLTDVDAVALLKDARYAVRTDRSFRVARVTHAR